MLNPRTRTRAGGSTILWDNKELKHKEQLIANFKELGLDGILFTAGKSGKTPYGRIKKYFRDGGDLPGGSTDSLAPGKVERLLFFYHPDHLGSSSSITDASGEVYQHVQYFPFGETFVEERTGTRYTPYLYNGKELDEETGLYYYGARYYDPRMGIFYGVDPLTEKNHSQSGFAYAANNPIKYIDLNGLDTFNINVNDRAINRIAVENSRSHTYNITKDGNVTTHTLGINQFGLVEFPNAGEGFGRYPTEDRGGTETRDLCADGTGGSTTNTGPGDRYLRPEVAAALFGLSSEMAEKPGGARIDFGDMSNAWGQAPWQAGFRRHSTHGGLDGRNHSGSCIDYRYLDGSFRSYQGEAVDKRFNVITNIIFLDVARQWGFSGNVVSNQNVWKLGPAVANPNAVKSGGHNDHGHLRYTGR
jgi:RHS repeat-associated protein